MASTSSSANETMASNMLCRDSALYRNPFNGYSCSEHDERACVEWKDVLNEAELDELRLSCPESCDLVSECMNATRPNLFGTPSESYLEETSSAAPTHSTGAALLWAFGAILMFYAGYKLYRRRHQRKRTSKLGAFPDPADFFSGDKDEESGIDGGKREMATHCCDPNEGSAFPVSANVPTPRWLPELNVSVDTDSSEGSGESAHRTVLSSVSFGEIIVLSPTNYMLSKRLEGGEDDGIRSPSGSVNVVHLLGAMRSYEEESDEYTVSSKSP